MKHFPKFIAVAALVATLVPTASYAITFTDAEAKKQLDLETQNLITFGNPFGKTGKFEELYDPTGKPWWKVQLDKEAWSLETYGNPFGYFIPQKFLPDAPGYVATVPVATSTPIVAPAPVVPSVVAPPVATSTVRAVPMFLYPLPLVSSFTVDRTSNLKIGDPILFTWASQNTTICRIGEGALTEKTYSYFEKELPSNGTSTVPYKITPDLSWTVYCQNSHGDTDRVGLTILN